MVTGRRGPSRLIIVAPEHIRFTQENVPVQFDHPYGERRRLDEIVELIMRKELSADDFPHMRVIMLKDQLWTLNNRSLWVFRKARVAEVVVKLQGRFDDEDSNSFLQSYMYRLMSPKHFIPEVRGECRLEFHHHPVPSFHEEERGVSLEIPPSPLSRPKPRMPRSSSPSSYSYSRSAQSSRIMEDSCSYPSKVSQRNMRRDSSSQEDSGGKSSTEGIQLNLRRNTPPKFVNKRNCDHCAHDTIPQTTADLVEKISEEMGGGGGRPTGRYSSRMKHYYCTTPMAAHIHQGKKSETNNIEGELTSHETQHSRMKKQEASTVPNYEKLAEVPDSQFRYNRTFNLQLLAQIRAVLEPRNRQTLYEPKSNP